MRSSLGDVDGNSLFSSTKSRWCFAALANSLSSPLSMDVPYGLPLDFTSCMTCEYDGGCWYKKSGPWAWKNGNAGRSRFVANCTGQMLSPIVICRLWTMVLWLVLYKASRIARKIQTIYRQCSKHSYYHSIQKDRLGRIFISPSDLKT